MLTTLPISFDSHAAARATLTRFRAKYRVALRGACVTARMGQWCIHVPLGGTGFSVAEMTSAMQYPRIAYGPDIEIPAPRHGRPGYRWVPGYVVHYSASRQSMPVRLCEALQMMRNEP